MSVETPWMLLASVAPTEWVLVCCGRNQNLPSGPIKRAPADFVWAEEPPAIVALLCAWRGELLEPAVTATYLDVIIRGFLRRAEGPEGQAGIAAAAEASLRPHQRSVLEHSFLAPRLVAVSLPNSRCIWNPATTPRRG